MTGTTGKAVVTYNVNEKCVGRLLEDLRSIHIFLTLVASYVKN